MSTAGAEDAEFPQGINLGDPSLGRWLSLARKGRQLVALRKGLRSCFVRPQLSIQKEANQLTLFVDDRY